LKENFKIQIIKNGQLTNARIDADRIYKISKSNVSF
jgi:hypothetical protein